MVADVTDEYHLATGNRREGILFAAVNFVAKVSTGIGAQISGLIVAYVGLTPKAAPSSVPDAISDSLAINVAGWFLILGCVSAALFMLYPLSQRRHETILADLAARDSAHRKRP
jgi:Na+/melibiose symporter-like transporter